MEDEDEMGDDDEDKETQLVSKQPIIQFFSRTLTTREKISLKKQYVVHLKEYLASPKSKEILELKCQLLKPFYQRQGTLTLTTHDILFFDDLFVPVTQLQEKDNIFFFKYSKKPD